MRDLLPAFSERLMRCPAAPYHEELVAAEVVKICDEHGLLHEFDEFGNILVRAASRIISAPLALAAHMDHPGFVIRKKITKTKVIGRFLGGVGNSYFKRGTKLLLMPGRIPAILAKRVSAKERDFEISTKVELRGQPEYAVWNLPEFQSKAGILRGRVCDDLIGVATILAVLVELRGSKSASNVLGVISRAEEVGFQGALALARSRVLPKNCLVISLETSRELPPARMGAGVIIRVGDRASIFDSAGTRYLTEVASALQKSDGKFRFQRALMSGGTCEATAYQEYGYRSAAVCVALGNYHNCGKKDAIAPEYVSAADAQSMRDLLVAGVRQWPRSEKLAGRLVTRLARLAKEGERQLRRTNLKIG